MKILKISLQNINSLKSNHPIEIDFESGTFKDVGLYAITGVTGAGKTTILDAITIALYQQVPRFKKSASKTSLTNVVSYGADDAMARVIFENNTTRYEAQWSIRVTAKNGKKLTKPDEQVRFKNLSNEQILAEKKNEFKIAVERVTQLNYDQFLRSVMLAQGEFAAFLSANGKEKGHLLEQITGEEIYKKIGEAILSQKAAETKKLEQLRIKVNDEDVLTDDQRASINQSILEIDNENNSYRQKIKEFEQIIHWYENNAKLKLQKEEIDHTQKLLDKEKETLQPALASLRLHNKAFVFQENIKELTREQEHFEKVEKKHKNLLSKLDTLTKECEEAQKQADVAKLQAEKKENLQKEWTPKLEKVTELDTFIVSEQQKKEEYQKKQEQQDKDILSSKEALNTLEQNLETEKNKLGTIQEFLEENIRRLDWESKQNVWREQLKERFICYQQVNEIKPDILKREGKLEQTKKDIANISKSLNTEKQLINQKKGEIELLEKRLKDKDLKNLLNQQEFLHQQEKKLTRAINLSKVYNEEFNKIQKLKAAENNRLEKEKEILQSIDNEEKLWAAAQQAVTDAEVILLQNKRILDFEEERKQLIPETPCPLCGSHNHPYVKEYQKIPLSKNEQDLENRKNKANQLQQNLTVSKTQLVALQTEIKNAKSQITDLQTNLQKYSTEFESFQPLFDITQENEISNALKELSTTFQKINQDINTIQEEQKNKETLNSELQNLKEKQATSNQKLMVFHENHKITRDAIDEKQQQIQTLQHKITDIEQNLEQDFTYHKLPMPSSEQTSRFLTKLNDRIQKYKEEEKNQVVSKNTIEQILLQKQNEIKTLKEKEELLASHSETLQVTESHLKEQISKRNEILPAEIKTKDKRNILQSQVDEANKKYTNAKDAFQDVLSEKLSHQELIKDLQEQITHHHSNVQSIQNEINTKIDISDFDTIEQIQKALLQEEMAASYQHSERQLEDKYVAINTQKKQWQETSVSLSERKNFEIEEKDAVEKKEALEIENDRLQQQKGKLNEQLKFDNQIRQRNKEIFETISSQEKEVAKWTRLMHLIGGSKDAFNTYVQRLTLQNLIHLANVHLYELNKRYSLVLPKEFSKGEELNFMMIDHYQANEQRLVDTSSGGEKFLISLSLALGLSDLASKNVSIGSLFIDEGFGTLDSNTLETVLSTLETLQSKGKMIGVISHIETLKERITTQIQVHKRANGISEIQVV